MKKDNTTNGLDYGVVGPGLQWVWGRDFGSFLWMHRQFGQVVLSLTMVGTVWGGGSWNTDLNETWWDPSATRGKSRNQS